MHDMVDRACHREYPENIGRLGLILNGAGDLLPRPLTGEHAWLPSWSPTLSMSGIPNLCASVWQRRIRPV
jgi:hypothetical protein